MGAKALSEFPCIFCDHQAKTMQQLCCHLLAKHAGVKGNSEPPLHHFYQYLPGQVRCWCGGFFRIGLIGSNYEIVGDLELAHPEGDWMGEWGKHLLKEGGLEAHVLALILE